jgi:hypothetical protein
MIDLVAIVTKLVSFTDCKVGEGRCCCVYCARQSDSAGISTVHLGLILLRGTYLSKRKNVTVAHFWQCHTFVRLPGG